MNKQFFTKVSPKAAQGIVRLYEREGYEVHSKPQSDGDFVVVVVKRDTVARTKDGLFSRLSKRDKSKAAAA